jgi:sensor histidine kinase YesM
MSTTSDTLLSNENWLLQFFISSKYRVYRHLLVILFIGVAMYNSDAKFIEPAGTISRIAALMLFLLLFYTNMYLLVPKFLFKNKYTAYILSVMVLIGISSLVYIAGWYLLGPYLRSDTNLEIFGLLPFSFVILVLTSASSAIKLFQRSISYSLRINELENNTLKSEMEQLKNQINPHFLFNMLNNANVLIKKDPEKASDVLMKLSDLLRYQLYDSARENVLLTSDIHFLEDFLNLEKVRRDSFDFMISKEGNLSGVQIPPLLFICFVENAVKHNNDSMKSSDVNLFLNVHNNELFFKCINSKPVLKSVNTNIGGLGLANITRRLELLFPSTHTLKIEDNPETYCVTLTIKL